ncbi:MAG TPA: hypothetical protein VL948_04040 [Verrucomicrobiae bacterium]|nr:hypothetical protein [Verrucomicrobiae bacterium]
MNPALIVAGCLALLGAVIHGGGGETLVMRELSAKMLPTTRLGGPRTTRLVLHVTWHLTTVAFLGVGVALLLSGLVLHGDMARGIALFAACMATAFAAVMIGVTAACTRSPRSLIRHPAPVLFTAIAALAWWGVL